jgi:CRP/FNR family transcriptional regulator, cyclic AMP receptor protein
MSRLSSRPPRVWSRVLMSLSEQPAAFFSVTLEGVTSTTGTPKPALTFTPSSLLARIGSGKSSRDYRRDDGVFGQGDAADAVYYLQSGKVKLTVVSARGKEAVIGILGRGTFFGEGCLAGQPLRMSTANAIEPSTVVRVRKQTMVDLLHREPEFAELFTAYLLTRNIRIEEDLIDQLFNSSEKRLARVLLLLAHFGKVSKPEAVIPKMTQDTLAAMVGTTRSRVSYFMNRFRKMGFIEYGAGGLKVHSGLLTVVLHD